ncbi:MAG: sugar phosphate isomerase/epimerase [Clostridia bacterium]|nr:sugar phosphate isomerase/epimerase [Clostridia bacterium]
MAFGVSSSCLYPMVTEDALRTLGAMGVKTCEVFLNAPSETTPAFAKQLRAIADFYGMRIVSAHPFSSFAEGYMLFGEYERRFTDMLDCYRRHFETAALLGAKISVIHGARLPLRIPEELYIERFGALVEAAAPFGVIAAQENVNRHISESPAFLQRMRAALGADFHLVFDIKQAVRAGYDPLRFYRDFAADTLHLHVSDHTAVRDCVAPGTGDFDFPALLAATQAAGYQGDWIIELYRGGFDTPAALRQALDYLESLSANG